MSEDMETSDLNKVINEEYKLWKKNAFVLYDLVITHALEWPSLTVQWFPDKESPPGKDYTIHRLLLGTHTSDSDKNYVQIAEVYLPKPNAELKEDAYDEQRGEIGSHTDVGARVKIKQSINHDGEVNRARYMPQNPELIATKTVMGSVYVFDRTKHPSEPSDDVCKPDITLNGHTKEGYGLAWNPTESGKGHILSASEDTTVCHWDIQAYSKANNVLEPLNVYRAHTAIVEDVAWHCFRPELFGSVGDDRKLMLWDTRGTNGASPLTPTANIEAHEAEVNAIAFSPFSETILLTGSSDRTVGLWDIRNLKSKLHTFVGHEDEVLQLAFSPHSETIFASGSSDRRINVWNMAAIGTEQTPEDAEDGPPELLFMHGGHTDQLTDLSWSLTEKWTLASTAEDNVLQVWSPSQQIYAADTASIAVDVLE